MSVRSVASTHCPAFLRPAFARLEASPLGLRLARGVFWSMAGTVISQGLMLVATVVVARLLGKTVYGEFGMIRSTVGAFGVFAGFGLGMTATKHVAEFRESNPDRAGRVIAMAWLVAAATGGLMALALVVFSPWLAKNTLNAPHLAGVLRIGALILFINALNGTQTGSLAGLEAFKTIARVNLVAGLFSFPVLIAGAHIGNLTGAVWGLVINLALNWLLNHMAIRNETRRSHVPITFSHCADELAILWRFSLPAILATIMTGPVTWACSAMLVHQPDGYGEMGIFSAANQWFTLILLLPAMLGSVLLPVLSEQLGQSKRQQSLRVLAIAIKINLLVVGPLVLVAVAASPQIMTLYGSAFARGWTTMAVVLLTAGLMSVNMPIGHVLAAPGRMWVGLAMNAGWALAFLLGTALLIPHGALGLATARLIAYVLHTIWVYAFAVSFLKE